MKHSGPISGLAPAGPHLVTSGYDGAVGVFDVAAGRYVGMHRRHQNLVTSVAAFGSTVFSGSADGFVVAAKIGPNGDLVAAGSLELGADVESMVMTSSSGGYAGLADGRVCAIDLHACGGLSATVVTKLSGTISSLRRLDDDHLLMTGNDGTLRVLDPVHGVDEVLYRSELPLKGCLVLEREGVVVTGGHDGSAVAVAMSGGSTRVLRQFSSSVRGLAATADHLYVGVYDGEVHRFVRGNLGYDRTATVGAPAGEIWTRHLAITVDGQIWAAGFNGMPLAVASTTLTRVASNVNRLVPAPAMGPATMLVAADDGQVLEVDASGEAPRLSLLHSVGECATGIAAGPEGHVATITWSGTAHVDGRPVLHRGEPLLGLTFTGRDLAFGTYSGAVLRVALDGTVLGEVQAMPSSVKSIVEGPGDRLYVVGRYGPMAVVDTTTWQVVSTVEIGTRVSDAVALSPSGALLAVAAAGDDIWVFATADLGQEGAVPIAKLSAHGKPPKAIAWEGEAAVVSVGYSALVARHELGTGELALVDLTACCDCGLSGVVSLGARSALVTAFDGTVRKVAFDA